MSRSLYTASLHSLRQQFSAACAPTAQQRSGFWRARFIGPFWLRYSGRPALALSGLYGWQGKRFINIDTATNVLQHGQQTHDKLQMHCQLTTTTLDGGTVLALQYDKDAPLPWRWVCDELRAVDEHTLLGMTRLQVPGLRALALPFLLERTP